MPSVVLAMVDDRRASTAVASAGAAPTLALGTVTGISIEPALLSIA